MRIPVPGTKLAIAWWATPSTMELHKLGVYDQPKNMEKRIRGSPQNTRQLAGQHVNTIYSRLPQNLQVHMEMNNYSPEAPPEPRLQTFLTTTILTN